jgi:hypothetical protein
MRLESLDIDHPHESREELDVLAEWLRSEGWEVEVAGEGEATGSRLRERACGRTQRGPQRGRAPTARSPQLHSGRMMKSPRRSPLPEPEDEKTYDASSDRIDGHEHRLEFWPRRSSPPRYRIGSDRRAARSTWRYQPALESHLRRAVKGRSPVPVADGRARYVRRGLRAITRRSRRVA